MTIPEARFRRWWKKNESLYPTPLGAAYAGFLAAFAQGQQQGWEEERERCRQIVDEHLRDEVLRSKNARDHGQSISIGYQEACSDIDTAIRTPPRDG